MHEAPDTLPPLELGGPALQVSVSAVEACACMQDESVQCWGWTDWWDGFDDRVCWIETEIPADGSHGSFPTVEREFSCDLHPRCCVGDDEPPTRAPRSRCSRARWFGPKRIDPRPPADDPRPMPRSSRRAALREAPTSSARSITSPAQSSAMSGSIFAPSSKSSNASPGMASNPTASTTTTSATANA